jgi:carnitine-CoA ligase
MASFDFLTGGSGILRLLAWQAEISQAEPFCIKDEVTVKYAELGERVNRFASALIGAGAEKGDRLAIYMESRPEFFYGMFGALRAGSVYVPFSTRYAPEEVMYQLEHVGARFALVDTEHLDVVQSLRDRLPALELVIVVDGAAGEGTISLADFMAAATAEVRRPLPSNDDLGLIMYTSGTTARPKGIMWSHGNLTRLADNVAHAWNWTRGDQSLSYFPLYHANGGLTTPLPAVTVGATLRMVPRFSVSQFFRWITEYEITKANVLAANLVMLLQTTPTEYDRAHKLKVMRQGLTAAPEDILAFEKRYNVQLKPTYGATEALGICAGLPWNHPPRPGSSGRALPGYQIRILDDEGNDVPTGQPGEIVVRAEVRYGVTLGYYRDEENTRATFRDGAVYTGDLAAIDEDGYIWFSGRKKDMIKRSGYNIAPAEVERVIGDLAEVLEVAVVGTPDRVREEAIVAFVAFRPGESIEAEVVIAHCKANLADYKVPQVVHIVESLPRNFSGKVENNRLREWALADRVDTLEKRSLGGPSAR